MTAKKKCTIIAVTNQKGGVAKTTTVQHIGYSLAVHHAKKVLLIDLDAQANLTLSFGIAPQELAKSVYNALKGDAPLSQVILPCIPNEKGKLDIAPSNIDLSSAEIDLIREINASYLLKSALTEPFIEQKTEEDPEPYDYILIDCPPSLGILTLNALVAADYVLIPIQPEMYALQGLKLLNDTIAKVKSKANSSLLVLGWLATLHDGRTRTHKDTVEFFRKQNSELVFNTIISVNTTVREAHAARKTVFEYDSSKSGAKNYAALTNELLRRLGDV